MIKIKNYQDELIESLKDHDEAAAYLNAAFEDSLSGDKIAQDVLLLALRNVAEAQGGIAKLAKKAHIGRESLYKTLSAKGNPELRTFTALIHAMGLQIKFC